MLDLLKAKNPIPLEMQQAIDRCNAEEAASEATSEPVVFKKRKVGSGGFRKKPGL